MARTGRGAAGKRGAESERDPERDPEQEPSGWRPLKKRASSGASRLNTERDAPRAASSRWPAPPPLLPALPTRETEERPWSPWRRARLCRDLDILLVAKKPNIGKLLEENIDCVPGEKSCYRIIVQRNPKQKTELATKREKILNRMRKIKSLSVKSAHPSILQVFLQVSFYLPLNTMEFHHMNSHCSDTHKRAEKRNPVRIETIFNM